MLIYVDLRLVLDYLKRIFVKNVNFKDTTLFKQVYTNQLMYSEATNILHLKNKNQLEVLYQRYDYNKANRL